MLVTVEQNAAFWVLMAAIAMRSLAETVGYSRTKTLLTKEATYSAVKSAIAEIATELKAEDIFLLTYSAVTVPKSLIGNVSIV